MVRDKQVLCVTKTNQILTFENVTSLFNLAGKIKEHFSLRA